MKKIYKLINISFILAIILSTLSFASTNTTPRDENNLQINNSILVTNSNKSLILKTPKVNETEKIYDFADLFTNTEETNLYNLVSEYIDDYNFDMVIVTINNNNKSSAQAYSDDFYDYNYFGKGYTFDGILFLIDMDTREMYISTTGECQRVYNDSRINSILDSTYSHITKKNYYNCAESFITDASKYAKAGVPSDNKNTYIDKNGDYIENNNFFNLLLPSAIYSFILTAIIIVIFIFKQRTIKKGTNAIPYFDRTSLNISNKSDIFINTYTSKTYIGDSSSGGGFSGGGFSTHFGSSGRSHGGGGRHF